MSTWRFLEFPSACWVWPAELSSPILMGMFALYRGSRGKACGVTNALFLSQALGLEQGTVALPARVG